MSAGDPLRVMVVDDEPLARQLMVSMLASDPSLEVVAEAGNIRQAKQLIETLRPELIFLDIEMPGGSGFDLVKMLQADTMPLVIFATAFDQYALAAFDLHAVDYLLKPFDPSRVAESVARARTRLLSDTLREGGAWQSKGQLLAALEQFQSQTAAGAVNAGKLAITDGGATTLLAFDSIDWVDAAGDYMCVHSGGKTYVMRSTLKHLEEKLAGTAIVRIHRSTLVNLNKVTEIAILAKGERQLTLENGAKLKVSRNYRDTLAPIER